MSERITGHTELIGLMAYPIRHSSSPAMQNEAFAKLGYDYAYLAFEVGADDGRIKAIARFKLSVSCDLLSNGGRIFADKASDSGFRETVFDSVLDSFSLI